MAFKKVEGNKKSIPFFDEYKKELAKDFIKSLDGTMESPKTIRHAQSGKGYSLNFGDEFIIFVWKNSGIGKAIKKYIHEEEGFQICLQFKTGKSGLEYDLGIDDEIPVSVEEDDLEEGTFYFWDETKIPPIAPLGELSNEVLETNNNIRKRNGKPPLNKSAQVTSQAST